MVNILNKYFVGAGDTYTKTFKNIPSKVNSMLCISSFNDNFIKNIETADVLNIITSLKDDTSVGFDKISIKILKIISKHIIDPLTYIP